jgi:dipeptidase
MMNFLWALSVAVIAHGAMPVDHCTGFIAGPKATVHGAPYVGQTNDAEGGPGDSLVFVPAADHSPGSKRPVLDQKTGSQIGEVPQISHTYAYTYLSYGVMNEHKLSFGESTCSGRLWAKSLAHNGTALFSNSELSKIALERCKTAQCAIKLMGDLAVDSGGFYGEGDRVKDGSESLLIADTEEAWVFHIMADPSGTSAIWAAQRVPDDKVAVVPNAFVIRDMKLSDSSNFLLSPNAISIAKEYGWGQPRKSEGAVWFDFASTFGLGEYANPHYAARRMWRFYDLLAPSLKLDPNLIITDTKHAYPFAVKPDRLVAVEDVIRVYRDYYEGTPYSLVKDEVAAGPFNSPLRIASGSEEDTFDTGAWERPISIYRGNYAVLNVNHPQGNGVTWFASHTPHASVFTPAFTSGATEVPREYAVDKTKSVDRQSLYWAANAVSNWAYGTNFVQAMKDVRAAQQKLEAPQFQFAEVLRTSEPAKHNLLLAANAKKAHEGWWDTFFSLMGKFNDGYVITHGKDGSVTSTAVGYPSWWLKAANFNQGIGSNSRNDLKLDFQDLKDRMMKAEAKMDEIDSKRRPPKTSNTFETARLSFEVVV